MTNNLRSIAFAMIIGTLTVSYCSPNSGLNPNGTTKDPGVAMAVYAADANTTDGQWLGVRIEIYDTATFTTLLQSWTSPANEQKQAVAATDMVLRADMTVNSTLMVPALPNTYYLKVQVWQTTDGAQGSLLMTGGPNEILKAQSNLLAPPSVALAQNQTTTVIVPLDWSLGLGNPSLVVETQDGVVFWVGGCISHGSGGAGVAGSVVNGEVGSITLTVRDTAGAPTVGVAYATISGNIATGCFYEKVIAPTGTTQFDVEANTTAPALPFTQWNAAAGGGDNITIASYPGSTVTLDILTD